MVRGIDYSNDPNSRFGWQSFAEGRARFAGTNGYGYDRPHEIVAIELDGVVSYGEMDNEWPDPNYYSLVVLSMGWEDSTSVGFPFANLPVGTVRIFLPEQAERAQRLIVQLVAAYVHRDRRAFIMSRADTNYTGAIRFADGWCYIDDRGSKAR